MVSRRFAFWIVVTPLLIAGSSALLRAQVSDGGAGPPVAPSETVASEIDVHEQMNELIARIELELRGTDSLLWETASGDVDEDARLASRLDGALARARLTVEHIDELLRLAQHPHKAGGT